MELQERSLRKDELLTADIRDPDDIKVTGVANRRARFAYLDHGEDPTDYRVSVEHVEPGEDVPNAEAAEYVVVAGPRTVVTFTESEEYTDE